MFINVDTKVDTKKFNIHKVFENYLNKSIDYDRINMIEKSIEDGIKIYQKIPRTDKYKRIINNSNKIINAIELFKSVIDNNEFVILGEYNAKPNNNIDLDWMIDKDGYEEIAEEFIFLSYYMKGKNDNELKLIKDFITKINNGTINNKNKAENEFRKLKQKDLNDCTLYIPVVTLSKDDEIKLLTNLKSGFKREIIWNKYRSQMSTEANNNNLNILIDPTFTNVNKLFVLGYQTADDRQSFSQFYLPKGMVKDYNVIIDKLAFFDLTIKTEEEAYEKIIDISRNNEYTTGNLLDYDYFKKYYKLVAIDLSKQQVLQENEHLIQQINFIGRLTEAANVFIIIEKRNLSF